MFFQRSESELNSLYSLLDGLTATLIVIFGVIFSLVVLYKARKMEAKLRAMFFFYIGNCDWGSFEANWAIWHFKLYVGRPSDYLWSVHRSRTHTT